MDEVLELEETHAGMHIIAACENAVALANEKQRPVHFKFNNVDVTVQPGEMPKKVEARWGRDSEAAHLAWIRSDEYKQREAKRMAEEKAADEADMRETATDETEMCAAQVPSPRNQRQLAQYIDSLVNRQHEYGTCVYAMSMAAEAAFNYVAHQLGVTGFQASCADMDFLRRTRSIRGPWMIIKAEDALYPQYDLGQRLADLQESAKAWLKEQAAVKLERNPEAHPQVIAHWKKLAGGSSSERKNDHES